MKHSYVPILFTIILLAIISASLIQNLNERSTNPHPTNIFPVTVQGLGKSTDGNTPVQWDKVPIIPYRTNAIHIIHTLGNVSLPLRFTIEGKQSQYGTKTRSFSANLTVGDAVELQFSSTQTVDFAIYAPGATNLSYGLQSYQWYSENTTHLSSRLIALRPGAYSFTFTTSAPEANVTFDAWKMKYDMHDVLFMESGGSSSAFGGMGFSSFFLGPPPVSFVVGRTWNNSSWTDHSTNFSSTLKQGTEVFYGYNATEPVIFSLASGSGTIASCNDVYSYQGSYIIPYTGRYTFSFDMAPPNTSIVSFRCSASDPVGYGDQTAAWVEDTQIDEIKLNYPFPPAINGTNTITGKLESLTFPTGKGSIMVLKQENSTKSYLLHLGSPSEFIPVTTEGSTMLGNVTLNDVRAAYKGNSTVRVTGFPFQLSLNGVVYELFHVNSAEILGQYPLYARQSMSIVSGYNNQGIDGEGIEYFPIRFSLGFNYYPSNGETYYGNIERYYSSYLKRGTVIKISYNATKPVEFGFYIFTDIPDVAVVNSFDLAKPSDYIFRESGVQSFEHLYTVPRNGFYTFAFKAYGGVESSVVLNASMVK